MRALLSLSLLSLAACGSSTDTGPTRYNFAIVDGSNQRAMASSFSPLGKPVTTQLTRDAQGKFASRIFDFFSPSIAYAQGLALAGEPIPNTLVCGRVAPAGEPQVVPLCAFTLADGTAPNKVEVGTLAGTYTILFTAQVPSKEPVVDSTTVIVDPGPAASHVFNKGNGFQCWTIFPANNVLDQYGNSVPYRFVTKGPLAHPASDVLGSEGARTLVPDRLSAQPNPPAYESQAVDVEVSTGVIASGSLTVKRADCVDLSF
jgi:hypothetical protein